MHGTALQMQLLQVYRTRKLKLAKLACTYLVINVTHKIAYNISKCPRTRITYKSAMHKTCIPYFCWFFNQCKWKLYTHHPHVLTRRNVYTTAYDKLIFPPKKRLYILANVWSLCYLLTYCHWHCCLHEYVDKETNPWKNCCKLGISFECRFQWWGSGCLDTSELLLVNSSAWNKQNGTLALPWRQPPNPHTCTNTTAGNKCPRVCCWTLNNKWCIFI